MTRLKLGDYLGDGTVFFSSARRCRIWSLRSMSGRLFTQAMRLASTSLRPAIILEGTSQDLAETGMSWERVQGALVTVTLFWASRYCEHVPPSETVRTMLYAAQQARVCDESLPQTWLSAARQAGPATIHSSRLPGIGPNGRVSYWPVSAHVDAVIKRSVQRSTSRGRSRQARSERFAGLWKKPPLVHLINQSRRLAAFSSVPDIQL